MSQGKRVDHTLLLWRRSFAEFLGTALLVTTVVGSGIAAQQLSPDDVGLQLLENSLATTFGLAVLILVFQPVSGASFNPVVTLVDRALGGGARSGDMLAYIAAQFAGGIVGAVLANVMFAVPTELSTKDRVSMGTLVAEVVATAGLVLVIFALVRTQRAAIVGPAVGAYIGAAYWFTSSTSVANPAVNLGRMFSDTFAGISPATQLPFIGAQLLGGLVAYALVRLFFPPRPATVTG
ncbi:Aquaporin Z [Corynebacterium guangdongense]|nr:Aquaporin Z [Corynebacterium guangdongense]